MTEFKSQKFRFVKLCHSVYSYVALLDFSKPTPIAPLLLGGNFRFMFTADIGSKLFRRKYSPSCFVGNNYLIAISFLVSISMVSKLKLVRGELEVPP